MNAYAIAMLLALGQWGSGGCSTGRCSVSYQPVYRGPMLAQPAATDSYEWRQWPGEQEWALIRNGVQIGAYNADKGYLPLLNGAWGSPTPAPIELPEGASKLIGNPPKKADNATTTTLSKSVCKCGPECPKGGCANCDCKPKEDKPATLTGPQPIFGLDPSKLSAEPAYWIGERKVTRGEVEGLIEGGGELPDWSAKPFLTVITKDDAQRKKIVGEIQASPLKDRFLVQGRDPSHWHLDSFKLDQDDRFKASGIVILAQDPRDKDGFAKVRDASYSYTTAADLERKLDPLYSPAKVPDASQGTFETAVLLGCLALIGGAFLAPVSKTEECYE